MKRVPRRLVVEWILQSWEGISTEMVANSIKPCALVLTISKDVLISCFTEWEKMRNRKSVIGKPNGAFQ